MRDLIFWLTPREPSFLLTSLFAAAAVLYGINAKAPAWRQICFWTGLALLYVSLQSGLDIYARRLVSLYSLQHISLQYVAPILIALSRPGDVFKGLSDIQRRLTIVNHPLVAPVLFSALAVVWCAPSLHASAMTDDRLYRSMNNGLALTGLMFWSTVLNGPAAGSVRTAVAAAVTPAQLVSGLILATAAYSFYPPSELADQRLAGLILCVGGSVIPLAVTRIIAARLRFSARAEGHPAR